MTELELRAAAAALFREASRRNEEIVAVLESDLPLLEASRRIVELNRGNVEIPFQLAKIFEAHTEQLKKVVAPAHAIEA